MMNRERSKTVSFRLSRPDHRTLRKRATDDDQSIGSCARSLVLDELHDTTRLELEQSIASLRAAIDDLRRDVSVTLEVLLLNVANLPEHQVREFVQAKLRGKT